LPWANHAQGIQMHLLTKKAMHYHVGKQPETNTMNHSKLILVIHITRVLPKVLKEALAVPLNKRQLRLHVLDYIPFFTLAWFDMFFVVCPCRQ
jgi:hypothetical protein